MGILPKDFFAKSIFGTSITKNEFHTSARILSALHIENFCKAGFPLEFCKTLEYGLPLLLGGNLPQRLVLNHPSVMLSKNNEFVAAILSKWEQLGVFTYVLQRPHIVNPLSIATNGLKKRLVFDPRSSGLPNIGSVLQRLYRNDYMIKLDLANGFLQLPIQRSGQTYFGFQSPIDGRFGILQRLLFGLRSAPFLFSTFTSALKQAAKQLLNITTEVYIDDWLLSSSNLEKLTNEFTQFTMLLTQLGVTI